MAGDSHARRTRQTSYHPCSTLDQGIKPWQGCRVSYEKLLMGAGALACGRIIGLWLNYAVGRLSYTDTRLGRWLWNRGFGSAR